ncbi:DUF1811 family protein [Paenibacillus sp. GD4]|uniref:DUF1811 family protein n=1 Tax=Paenibacillus sp. GD4 TaxID=3068890 RepID=UPI00279674B5|nr:DUF1811 family protein [Paenibacillus sp. GD4]MDQ1913072.1 DUF1811 family protein [Paenibacillus sp. GD4]
MKKLYSQMSREELEAELRELSDAMEKAEFPSQKNVLQSKYVTAKAYTLDPADFTPGVYKVDGVQTLFELKYINGIYAWGSMDNEPEASFPISMLVRL